MDSLHVNYCLNSAGSFSGWQKYSNCGECSVDFFHQILAKSSRLLHVGYNKVSRTEIVQIA